MLDSNNRIKITYTILRSLWWVLLYLDFITLKIFTGNEINNLLINFLQPPFTSKYSYLLHVLNHPPPMFIPTDENQSPRQNLTNYGTESV